LRHPRSQSVESGSNIYIVALRANNLVDASGASIGHCYILLDRRSI